MTTTTETDRIDRLRRALETVDFWLLSPSFDPEVVGAVRELVRTTLETTRKD